MPISTQNQRQRKQVGQPGPAAAKLRSSCDACHVAKVKCSSDGPQQTCFRCLSHSVPCTYSPSLRIGKPHGSRNHRQSVAASSTSSSRRASVSYGGHGFDSTPASSQSSRRISEASSRGSTQTLPDELMLENGNGNPLDLAPEWQEIHGSGELYDPRQMSSLLPTPSTSIAGHAFRQNSMLDFTQPRWTNQSGLSASEVALPTDQFSQNYLLLWNESGFDPVNQQTISSLLPSSPQSGMPKSSQPSEPNHQQSFTNIPSGCPCLPSILRALESSPVNTKTARDHPPSTVTLDVLLATNKRAVNQCITMLSCACFGSSTSFLLLSALLNQSLGLYQLACEEHLTHSSKSRETSIVETQLITSPEHATEAQILHSSLSSPRLDFGAYRIEAEDDLLLKRELMLLELRKVEGLLDRFRERVAKVRDRVEGSTYDGLVAQMTRCLQRTVVEVQGAR